MSAPLTDTRLPCLGCGEPTSRHACFCPGCAEPRRALPLMAEALRDWRAVLGSLLFVALGWAALVLGG